MVIPLEWALLSVYVLPAVPPPLVIRRQPSTFSIVLLPTDLLVLTVPYMLWPPAPLVVPFVPPPSDCLAYDESA